MKIDGTLRACHLIILEPSIGFHFIGDISACFYQYLAGITPDSDNPGFKKLQIKPHPLKALNWIKAEYRIPAGNLKIGRKKNKGKFHLEIILPTATTLTMHDGSTIDLPEDQHNVICEMS